MTGGDRVLALRAVPRGNRCYQVEVMLSSHSAQHSCAMAVDSSNRRIERRRRSLIIRVGAAQYLSIRNHIER